MKQDPVSTCSSTELSTKAWRSGAGEGLQRDAASTGPREQTGCNPTGLIHGSTLGKRSPDGASAA